MSQLSHPPSSDQGANYQLAEAPGRALLLAVWGRGVARAWVQLTQLAFLLPGSCPAAPSPRLPPHPSPLPTLEPTGEGAGVLGFSLAAAEGALGWGSCLSHHVFHSAFPLLDLGQVT